MSREYKEQVAWDYADQHGLISDELKKAIPSPGQVLAGLTIALGAAVAVEFVPVADVAENIGIALMAVGYACAGLNLGAGAMSLKDFYDKTSCDNPNWENDIPAAANSLAYGLRQLGTAGIQALLTWAGGAKPPTIKLPPGGPPLAPAGVPVAVPQAIPVTIPGIQYAGPGTVIAQGPQLAKRDQSSSGSSKPGSGHASLKYKLKPQDLDWRGTGKGVNEALEEAFRRTGRPKSDFKVTRWGQDAYGKSHPVEWQTEDGADVNIDWAHNDPSWKPGQPWETGPDAPHVGWQTAGKRGSGGAQRGHILLDEVPFNR